MVFATADKSLADTFTVDNVNLYRVTDAKPPVTDMPIWLPVTTYTADRRHASILYGTSADSTWIHYAVYTDKALLKQSWIEAAAGMHHFDYDIPADADRIKVKFTGVNDYKVSDFEVTATASGTVDRINIAIESFRDKIAPGDNEKWPSGCLPRPPTGCRCTISEYIRDSAMSTATIYRYTRLSASSCPVWRYHSSG